MLVDGLVVRATSRDTVSADATPSGAVGAHRHDEPIVVVGSGGNSGRAVRIEATAIDTQAKKKNMKLGNTQGLNALQNRSPRISRHEGGSPDGPGGGVVLPAIAPRDTSLRFRGLLSNSKR